MKYHKYLQFILEMSFRDDIYLQRNIIAVSSGEEKDNLANVFNTRVYNEKGWNAVCGHVQNNFKYQALVCSLWSRKEIVRFRYNGLNRSVSRQLSAVVT